MDKLDNSNSMQHTKDEFKVWLKKFHEQLTKKHQALKSDLRFKQQTNKDVKNSIEKHSNCYLTTSCLAIDVVPKEVQMQLVAGVNYMKTKSEQLSKGNETINGKVEDETKRMRYKFYEMITKNDVALKPFHEVEDAIKDLTLKTDCCKREHNVYKENFVMKLKEREGYFNGIQESILIMEPIEKEMRFFTQSCKKILETKLKSLQLKSIEEASEESNESKELLADISNMKSQLKK